MPNVIRKIRGKNLYKVFNKDTGVIHCKECTLDNAKSQLRLLHMVHNQSGEGIATDSFNPENKQSPVLLPFLNETNLLVPKYFITQIFSKRLKEGQRKFKLFIPTTATRNLSTRNKKKSIEVKRVNRDEIELIDGETITPPPKLSEFSKKDSQLLKEYFAELKTNPPLQEYSLEKPTPRPRRPRKQKTPEPIYEEPEPIYEEPEPIYEEPEPIPEPSPIEPPVREQKKRGRKLKYATVEEAKEAQARQKREASKKLYKTLTKERLKQKAIRKGTYAPNNMETQNYEGENEIQLSPMEGEGIIRDIKKGVSSAVNTVVQGVKKASKFAEKVFDPDDWMPPSVKLVLRNYGIDKITKLTLRRNPVSELITDAMNVVSGGTFYKNLKKQPYDRLFHLGLVVSTERTTFVLEKIERVNVSYHITKPKGLEELDVPLGSQSLTVNDLINKTKERMGKNKFLDYDGFSNNCQDFIMNVLQANGLSNEENTKFIKQNTQVLFKDSPILAKVSKKLTDIGASMNVLMKGGEIEDNKNTPLENKILPNNITMDLNYLLPQKRNQHHLQLYSMSADTDSFPEPLEAGLPAQVQGRGIGRALKKVGRKIGNVVNKVESTVNMVDDKVKAVESAIDMVKNIPANARAHYKQVGLDIAEILLKKGVPVTAGTIAGIMGTMAGGPALGIASSVGASYLTGLAANKIAEEEGVRGSSGSGLYAQGGRGCGSDDECDNCCEMCGGKLLVDRKISIRDAYNAVKSVPKQVNKNIKSLKEGEDMEGGMVGMPKPPKVITNGVRGPSGMGLGKRPTKGSPEMKAWMAKLRSMKKKK